VTLHLTTTGGGLCHAGYSVCNVTTCDMWLPFSFYPSYPHLYSLASSFLQFRHVFGTDRESRERKNYHWSRQPLATNRRGRRGTRKRRALVDGAVCVRCCWLVALPCFWERTYCGGFGPERRGAHAPCVVYATIHACTYGL